MDTITLPSGIIVPNNKPKGVQCGYCPKIIFKEQEARGRLFLMDNRPACARCRILRTSKLAGKIRHDKPLYDKDVATKEAAAQKAADDMIKVIAAKSQKDTKTERSRK